MSLHDDYARVTPYELAFEDPQRIDELASAVEEEAAGRGVASRDLNGFLTLGTVDAFVREIAGEAADPAALHQYGPLAFHLVRFQREGKSLFLLSTHVARYLVEGAPDGEPEPPATAGYLQLPQHLFWTKAAGDAPESVDGVFWSSSSGGILHTLMVTGIRPDRPGLGAIPLPAAPLDDRSEWLELTARQEEPDFVTDLPGADLDGLYEMKTAGEIFKLLARFFAYVQGAPEALETASAPPTSEEGAQRVPSPSSLEYARVTLGRD